MEGDSFPEDTQLNQVCVPIPTEISGWFPEVLTQGRISTEAFKQILADNPQPQGGILQPPQLDRYLRPMLNREAIKGDEIMAANQADTGRIIRPIICIAATAKDPETLRSCRQAVSLANNALAKTTVQRKAAILRALKVDEADINYWCREHSDSQEWLFGQELQAELEAKQQRQFQQSITKIVMDGARTYSNRRGNASVATNAHGDSHNSSQPAQTARGGSGKFRGRGKRSYSRKSHPSSENTPSKH